MSGSRILVIDDDAGIRRIVQDRFRAAGHDVAVAASGEEGLGLADSFEPELVLLDLRMPGMDGLAVLDALRRRPEPPEVIMITAHGSIEAAVRAVRAGAADFIPKPFEAAQLEHVVERTLETARLRRRVDSLEVEISDRHALVTGSSPAMQQAVGVAARAAASEATVLLLGESGSGKEVLARHVHRHSKRSGGPFVAINCATLSAELLESELFGHERGAFTGAVKTKPGKIELAAGGTLFLDEIAELAPALQARLLRVLQEREFQRVGGTRTLKADVRLVVATHQDLTAAKADGRFREDLYYRLAVVTIRVPALRERVEDIPGLVEHFLARHAREARRGALRIDAPAREVLQRYGWPGNVRELSNAIERAVVLATSETIGLEDLPEEIVEAGRARSTPPAAAAGAPGEETGGGYHDAVLQAKRRIIQDALRRTGGHQTRAAKLLGLTQPYLARLIKQLEVPRDG